MSEKTTTVNQSNTGLHLKGTIKLNLKSLIVFAIFAVLVFIEYKYNGSYFDEILGIVSILVVIYKWNKIYYQDFRALFLLFVNIGIGLFSNLLYEIHWSWFSVAVDVLTQVKLIFCFMAIRYFLSEREKQIVIDYISPIARLYFLAAFALGVYTQIFDTGMHEEIRYGLKTFRFIFEFSHQYTSVSFLMIGAIISATNIAPKKKNFYTFIGTVAILLALKSPAIIYTVSFIFLYYYFKKYQKLNYKIIVPLIIALIAASTYQIQTYLLNDEAARRIFFQYAFKTANRFFPLGSGFATYGSAEAAKHYSQLYVDYKFYKHWGMGIGENGQFLYDTYWPMVIGQFGWIGMILFAYSYINMFKSIQRSKADYSKKAYIYAMFIQYMVHAMGASILSSSTGLIGFMALSLYTFPDPEKEQIRWNTRVHLDLRD